MLTQTSVGYLVSSKINAYIFEQDASPKQRYRTVYAKTLKLYRGIDNLLRFNILNQEQRTVDLRTLLKVNQIAMAKGGQGTGYAVGDILTVKGGDAITPAQIRVLAVDTILGKILDYELLTEGTYTRTPKTENNMVLGGSGKNASFNLYTETLNVKQIEFNILREENNSVFVSLPVTIVDPEKGLVEVVINEEVLSEIPNIHVNYSMAYRDDVISPWRAMYVDDNFEVRGQLEILPGHYPIHHPSVRVNLLGPVTMTAEAFYGVSGPTIPSGATIYSSSHIFIDSEFHRNNSLHTAQYNFGEGFNGVIRISVTLDPLAAINGNPAATTWAIHSITNYNESGTTYVNWEGVYTAIKFDVMSLDGSLPIIYYRN